MSREKLTARNKILAILKSGHKAKDIESGVCFVPYNKVGDYIVTDGGDIRYVREICGAYKLSDIEIYVEDIHYYKPGDLVMITDAIKTDPNYEEDNKCRQPGGPYEILRYDLGGYYVLNIGEDRAYHNPQHLAPYFEEKSENPDLKEILEKQAELQLMQGELDAQIKALQHKIR